MNKNNAFIYRLIFLITAIWIFSNNAYSQTIDSLKGSVEGIVMDTAGNYTLPSATISIYKSSDSTLLKYSLSDNLGRFRINNLPQLQALFLKVDYIGYRTKKQMFTIPMSKKLDLSMLNMQRSENMLQEVDIKGIPPIRLNGDTLEFNADAFKLDPNAVVEDLMKKIPGIVMWSDGLITVNGKTVNKVLVEGKPFFGGNTRIATQNLPKESVEKIQVYEDKRSGNEINNSTNVNIVLKKNKKNGLFGKVGSGYGTTKRFDHTAMLNFFNPKTQISATGVLNNVNKTASNVFSLMDFSSYKGEGVTTNYTSDFSKRGINRFGATGYTLEHEINKNNKLKTDYFYRDSKTTNLENLETIIAINNQNITRNLKNRDISGFQGHTSNSSYNIINKIYEGYLSSEYGSFKNVENSSNTEQTFDRNGLPVSSSLSTSENNSSSRNLKLNLGINSLNSTSNSTLFRGIQLDYSFNYYDSDGIRLKNTDFQAEDGNLNRNYKRSYEQEYTRFTHSLDFVKQNIFGLKFSHIVGIHVKNYLTTNTHKEDVLVEDFTSASQLGLVNNNLTNTSSYNVIDERLGFSFNKSLIKKISGRYLKVIDFDVFPQLQYYNQHNSSLKDFQKLEKSYLNFVPTATFSYNYEKPDMFKRSAVLSLKKTIEYPQINELAPLVDESNVYYQNYGNSNLKPASDYGLNLNLKHTSLNKVPILLNLNLRMGIIKGAFADSSLFDQLGRNAHYTVNVSQKKYVGLNGSAYKTYRFDEHGLQLNYLGFVNYYQSPGYLNSIEVRTTNIITNNAFGLNYEYHKITIGLTDKLETFKVEQVGKDVVSRFRSFIHTATAAGKLSWPKNFVIGTNLNYSINRSSNADKTDFLIWNASLSFRFLKQKNAEIGLNALDILKQNTGLINTINYNSLTKGQTNILQQYFMIKLSYFPRKFGF